MASTSIRENISSAIQYAFVDKKTPYFDENFIPRLLNNEELKLAQVLEHELKSCANFAFSVAFITNRTINNFLSIFSDLNNKGIQGRILTTDYQSFTDPAALEALQRVKNVEVRLFQTDEKVGFHTKGYLFEQRNLFKFIIGSSNLTDSALKFNKEWNILFLSNKDGAIATNINNEFEKLWSNSRSIPLSDDVIKNYKERYQAKKDLQRQLSRVVKEKSPSVEEFRPNTMQLQFINALNVLVNKKKTKALLLSATGTGKTFAAAFAIRDLVIEPKKMLFLVHREEIAKQALKTFSKVFRNRRSMGLLTGNHKDLEADFVFGTVQTISRDNALEQFQKNDFDVIVIDEVHHAGAPTYQKIMGHFEPKLWLGLTATPTRTDGFDIFSLFDHNIAHEISLRQALNTDLLCPFHYFGVSDLDLGENFDSLELRDFNKLTSKERVKHILAKAKYYGHGGIEGTKLKGLIFCSRKDEAQKIAELMGAEGYRCQVLTGDDSQETRISAIDRLSNNDKRDDGLDYILTVDIFNEGVDIPKVNQIIMLRATESPIVFIQQLGRGLRKADGKDFVVILDFIGNYSTNYFIPIALSGDRSYNKDNMRRHVTTPNTEIEGASTVHFEEIAKKRILDSIDKANTTDSKLIRQAYQNLKFRLGHIPSLQDFVDNGTITPIKIFDKYGSYYEFLNKFEPDYPNKGKLDQKQQLFLQWVSQKYARGKRADELKLIADLISRAENLNFQTFNASHWINALANKAGFTSSEYKIINLTKQLSGTFNSQKLKNLAFIHQNANGSYSIDPYLVQSIQSNLAFRNLLTETIEFGLKQNQIQYANRYKETDFVLYQKYTYDEVQRLLGWTRNLNAQNIGGYFYDAETKTLPVFINYVKEENAIAYEDRFISPDELIALSKHPRKASSTDADHMFKRTEADRNNKIYLFVRKNKDDKETKEFYFLGEINAHGNPTEVRMPESNDTAFEIQYKLETPVRADIFEYITEG